MSSGVQEVLSRCQNGWVDGVVQLELTTSTDIEWMFHEYYFYLSSGKLCIEVTPQDKIAMISETLCIGCGICVKVCTRSVLTVACVIRLVARCSLHIVCSYDNSETEV